MKCVCIANNNKQTKMVDLSELIANRICFLKKLFFSKSLLHHSNAISIINFQEKTTING